MHPIITCGRCPYMIEVIIPDGFRIRPQDMIERGWGYFGVSVICPDCLKKQNAYVIYGEPLIMRIYGVHLDEEHPQQRRLVNN